MRSSPDDSSVVEPFQVVAPERLSELRPRHGRLTNPLAHDEIRRRLDGLGVRPETIFVDDLLRDAAS